MASKDSRRRLLLAAAALLLCAAAVFLLLWLNPNRVYTYQAQTASAAQAAETCPFALITRQEFQLAAPPATCCISSMGTDLGRGILLCILMPVKFPGFLAFCVIICYTKANHHTGGTAI